VTDIKEDSVITFYPLDMSLQEGEWIVGRKEVGSFISLPEVGVKAINLLMNGLTIEEAKKKLEEEFGEEVELKEFVESLIEVGFVKNVDDELIETEHEEIHAYFENLKQEHAQLLFSKPAYILYMVVMAAGGIVLLANPRFVPRFSDFMFVDSYTVALVTTFVMSWLFVFKHEFYHLAAAKSLGLDAQFRISHRLYFVVAETDITSVWTVPREKRYRVYFAGILSDLVTVSLVLIVLWIFQASDHVVLRFLKALILMQIISMVWQCLFFMKTDVYYIMTNYFNCKNLFGDTLAFLSNLLHRVWDRFPYRDLSAVPQREMRIVRGYSIFFVLGNIAATLFLLSYVVPRIARILFRVSGEVKTSYDSIAFLGILCINVILLVRSMLRQRRQG
jgi:putative peptide zinc metalloprotease protein